MNAKCGVQEVELWELAESNGTATHSRLSSHVAACPPCQERLVSMQRLCAALESMGGDAHGPLPEAIGPYRITRLIGEGGMGIVYEAEQCQPRRRVALKVMRAWANDSKGRRRFKCEIEALGRLNHLGISRIYDAGQADTGQPWFVMEYVEGRALDKHCERRKLDLRERLTVFRSVLDAVAEAHACGVVHRDLKPANILVDESGRIHVLDFGLAHLTGAEFELSLTLSSMAPAGTLPYMSPEQVSSSKEVLDEGVDVYSLGVILYVLVTGHHPYAVKGTLSDGIRTITETAPTTPSRVAPVDRELEAVILRCLAKERKHRYPSASALAAEIDRYLAGRSVEARPLTLQRRARAFVVRKRRAAGLAASVVLLAGVGATFALMGPGEPADGAAAAPRPQRGLVIHEASHRLSWGALSPDGDHLAFTIWPEGDVGRQDLETNEVHRLTRDASWDGSGRWAEGPVWSPEGDRIAYAWLSHPAYKIRTVGLRGNDPRIAWEGESVAWPVAWSQEGILATITTETACTLLLIPPEGGAPYTVHSWSDHFPEELALSPDGRYLVCVRTDASGAGRVSLRLLDLETGSEELLTSPSRHHDDYGPVWTPDARCVLFMSGRSGSQDLWAMRVRDGRPGGPALRLRADEGSSRPIHFCRDGTFYFSINPVNSDVYVTSLDPGTHRASGSPSRLETGSVGNNGRSAWSSDGRYLTFVSERGPRVRGRRRPVAVVRDRRTGEEHETTLPFRYKSRGRGGVPPRLSPDGKVWAVVESSAPYNNLILVPVGRGEARQVLTHVRRAVRWCHDGQRILCFRGDHPAHLTLLDVGSGVKRDLVDVEHPSMGGMAVSPGGHHVAIVDSTEIEILSIDEPGRIRTVWRSPGGAACSDLSWIEGLLVFNAGGKAMSLRLDDADLQATPLGIEVPGMLDLAVHPEGRHLAFSGTGPGRSNVVHVIPDFAAHVERLLVRAGR